MSHTRRTQEARTIWINLDHGVRLKDWGSVQRNVDRLAELTMDMMTDENAAP